MSRKVRELAQTVQDKNYCFILANSPMYWPTDNRYFSNQVDIFVTRGIYSTHTDINSSYYLILDHTPTKHMISTTVVTNILSSNKSSGDTYHQIIQENINLSTQLKELEKIETETSNLIRLLQEISKQATPNIEFKKQNNNVNNKQI